MWNPFKRPAPEVVVKTIVVMGTPEPVTLYESYEQGCGCSGRSYGHFSTYEKAFEVFPQFSVRPVKFYKVGEHYIENIEMRLLDLKVDSQQPDLTRGSI